MEMVQFLSEKARFAYVPIFAGSVAYRRCGKEAMMVGALQEYVMETIDAWSFVLDAVASYFDRYISKRSEVQEIPRTISFYKDLGTDPFASLLQELIGAFYVEMIDLLGKRTAQMHMALGSARGGDEAFLPEPFSSLYQRSLYQSIRYQIRKGFSLLSENVKKVPDLVMDDVRELLSKEKEILKRLERIFARKIQAKKTRIHGDYHLGQVLFTGQDFVIIDFEGEPTRSLSERRLKHSPLRDVAGMLRSFHYAAYNVLHLKTSVLPDDVPSLEPWADLWCQYMSSVFLRAYKTEISEKSDLIPKDEDDFQILLDAFTLEKAIYEITYELNNRPDWIIIPVRGFKSVIEGM